MASRSSRPPRATATTATRTPAQADVSGTGKVANGPSRAAAKIKPATPRTAAPGDGDGAVTETRVAEAPELTKKELIDSVLERSQVKKKFAKPVVEAMIEVIGDAIAAGRGINLQPMGKIKPQRTKDSARTRVVMAKIRQNKPAARDGAAAGEDASDNPKQTLANDAE